MFSPKCAVRVCIIKQVKWIFVNSFVLPYIIFIYSNRQIITSILDNKNQPKYSNAYLKFTENFEVFI